MFIIAPKGLFEAGVGGGYVYKGYIYVVAAADPGWAVPKHVLPSHLILHALKL